ncbi:MAG: ATP-binding cassette domain-containing protein [Bifidobacteriaceae bacterium]|nr:ATP-binding cassette domain-containing protein [Bifidobacteriaceae bacterium]
MEACGLTKGFGGRLLWSELSFEATPGSITAITGASGAGKTTLLNCLAALEPIDSGSIMIGGSRLHMLRGRQRRLFFRDQLGMLFQNYGLVENWTARRNLEVAIRPGSMRRSARERRCSEALAVFGLDGVADTKVFKLSGGEQQRVALARLAVKEPRLVLADEPTGSLDQSNADLVISTLREMAGQGRTVVISTHDPAVVSQCDHLIELGVPSRSATAARYPDSPDRPGGRSDAGSERRAEMTMAQEG